jgi:hypothetical protein
MPRDNLFFENWSIPDPYSTPGPWNVTMGFGTPPGTFEWDANQTILTYSDSLLQTSWNASAFKSPRVAADIARAEMECYCRERNLLDNQYRQLSKDIVELTVGNRTTIISCSLVGNLFDHHWILVGVKELCYVVTTIDQEYVQLDRFLLRAQSGETIIHKDRNPLNNTADNLVIEGATAEGDRMRASPWPDTRSFDDDCDYMDALPLLKPQPIAAEDDYDFGFPFTEIKPPAEIIPLSATPHAALISMLEHRALPKFAKIRAGSDLAKGIVQLKIKT